ncbi:ammonium transporter [Maritalea sp.]|jgi:Amt family ammonium transporter|uniref:ammonium transporter n=1 Tax=Maritalea sp. TaxID=2003361 RepID=UPI0039E42B77
MNGADTSWVMTATALVLLMTLPGLALFYAGLVQTKNILSVLMHVVAVACLASILWFMFGYSLAFTEGNAFIGGLSRIGLAGIERDSLSGTIPESLWVIFQMTFAVITPALMIGAFVERIKFSAVLIISGAWLLLVYVPVTHWVWGGGWLAQLGVIDFAGGIVVHITAGVSAAVIALMLGARTGFPHGVQPPHAPWMVMVGASLLWVGWFGFNGGSAVAANGDATMAILVTHLSAATASLVWMVIEWVRFGKPSIVGIVTGTIAGLATITPASGSVGPMGAIVLGLVGGLVCFYAVDFVKSKMKVDDSLDVLAVHGVGGASGSLLLAFLLTFGSGASGYAEGVTAISQFGAQVIGVVATAIWSLVVTVVIVWITKQLVGLRVDKEAETTGLDLAVHGETGYRH